MSQEYLVIKQSPALRGEVHLSGAKNAALVIIASLILTKGTSTLHNVPNSADIQQMIKLLENLGADIVFDCQKKVLVVDTTKINSHEVQPEIMKKMRASILVMGPLLARFKKALIAMPGGCLIGTRPINFHLEGFKMMGVTIEEKQPFFYSCLPEQGSQFSSTRVALDYPSVGATENLLMLAALKPGVTSIINAALEPEVLDLIKVLKKMGANIVVGEGLTLKITGVKELNSITHSIIPDRLEAGSLLLAAAITQGSISIPNANAQYLDLFLKKLRQMGHYIKVGTNPCQDSDLQGITLHATNKPKSIEFQTGCYPGFPTDLQAQTMAALCLANGTSIIEETVFENRFMHVKELEKMGAQITVTGNRALVRGVEQLYGNEVIASDIRASCALAIAGLAASGTTKITGINHWKRGHDKFETKLQSLSAKIYLKSSSDFNPATLPTAQKPLE